MNSKLEQLKVMILYIKLSNLLPKSKIRVEIQIRFHVRSLFKLDVHVAMKKLIIPMLKKGKVGKLMTCTQNNASWNTHSILCNFEFTLMLLTEPD